MPAKLKHQKEKKKYKQRNEVGQGGLFCSHILPWMHTDLQPKQTNRVTVSGFFFAVRVVGWCKFLTLFELHLPFY